MRRVLITEILARTGRSPPQTLIVSNLFEDVATTRRQRVALTLNANGFESSITEAVPQAPPTRSAARATDPVRAAAADQVATGLAALSAHARNGLSVGFDPDAAPCPEPFRFEPCGPTINLSLSPGGVGGFDSAAGTGGDLSAAAQAIARTVLEPLRMRGRLQR